LRVCAIDLGDGDNMISEMATTCLRFEDRLDGASNFLSWKVRVTLLLEENDLCDIIKKCYYFPYRSTGVGSSQQERSEGQVDAIKDHLIPHISEKKTMKEMFDALVSLY
jgi:hypothetical protein